MKFSVAHRPERNLGVFYAESTPYNPVVCGGKIRGSFIF